MRIIVAVGFLAAACGVAGAQAPQASPMPMESGKAAASCAAMDAKLPVDYASWTAKGAATSAKSSADLAKAELAIGKSFRATLLPTPSVDYPTQPEKPGGSVSKGGLFSVKVAMAGTYFVALGGGAWIDLVDKDGKAAESVAHGHGPDCSTIRKVVDFRLSPGAYTLQVSSYTAEKLDVLVGKRQ